jgi:cell division protein FtsB
MLMEQTVIEQLIPWLGGGAVTFIASLTMWLWVTYFKQDQRQKDQDSKHLGQSTQLLDDMRRDRDHWREMATHRHGEIMAQQELLQELRRRNNELAKQNALLQSQNEIMREEKTALLSRLRDLEGHK